MKLEANTPFDRYKLLRKLGEGGYSEVWLVEDTLADVKCAIKIFLPSEQMNEQGLDVFKDEYKIIHNLNHPNLLKYNHLGVYNGYPYLEMPFCDGGSAEQLIGKCDEKTCWQFIHDVAAGLAHLHSQSPPIIHQDIKPDNILINQGGYVITDFGISLNTQSSTDEDDGVIKGTKPYMPPEKFTEGYSGPIMAGDIWALGASAFELITGQLPFPQGGSMQKVDTPIPTIHGNYSYDLIDLINRCMSYHRWDRPLARDIEEIAEIKLNRRTSSGGSSNTYDDMQIHQSPAYTSYQPVKKGPQLWLIILISAVVIAASAVVIALVTKDKDPETIYITNTNNGKSNMPDINTGENPPPAPKPRPAQTQNRNTTTNNNNNNTATTQPQPASQPSGSFNYREGEE